MPNQKPSAEEIEEKRRQRAEKKRVELEKKEAAEKDGLNTDDSKFYTPRSWIKKKDVEIRASSQEQRVRILSWNILAQGLVRRKLFPGSDCLKWKEREEGLCAEMRSHDWDIAAFQEVDKIEVHGPNIEKSGRKYIYEKGYASKQHGLMICWRVKNERHSADPSRLTFMNEPAASKIIYYDLECVGPASEGRKGLSRVTRNIALFTALTSTSDEKIGVIVATTHLFWHPSHAYERSRQTGILKRALLDWKDEHNAWKDWPIILAGDFNDQPHSATYNLMTGEALTEHNWNEIRMSSVVHKSVEEAKLKSLAGDAEDDIEKDEEEEDEDEEVEEGEDEDEEDEEGKDDRREGNDEKIDDQMIKNCRHALPDDGILSLSELIQLHNVSQPRPFSLSSQNDEDGRQYIGHKVAFGLTSTYGANYGLLVESQEGNFFGSSNRGRERFDDVEWTPKKPNPHLGPSKEPMWTLHSTIFALTLDYIFLFPSIHQPAVTALLPTHRTEVLAPGVPRKGICASDHIAIGAELSLIL